MTLKETSNNQEGREFRCPSCGGRFRLKGQTALARSIPCPKCKVPLQPLNRAPEIPKKPSSGDEDELFDWPRGPAAIIYWGFNDPKDPVIRILRARGLEIVEVGDKNHFLRALRYTQPEAVILAFGPEDTKGIEIWQSLSQLSTQERRRFFSALIGPYKTLDDLEAFRLSVDLTINPRDIPHLADVLSRAWQERERLYRKFLELLDRLPALASLG
ncbi:hypothetical protein [Thermosulfuriphilus sp.]